MRDLALCFLRVCVVATCAMGNWGCQGAGKMNDDERAFAEGANKPPSAESLHAAARVVASRGRDSECEFLLTRTIREYPHYLPAYSDLAELRMRQRQVGEAIKILEAALTKAPSDPVLLNNLALSNMIQGTYDEALSAITAAVAAQPHNARYRANLATVLGMMGRHEEALSLYEQILPPEDAYHNLAVLHQARGTLQGKR